MSKKYKYQLNFSKNFPILLNEKGRKQKADKIISILEDYYKKQNINLNSLSLLDIGSSTGIITKYLSQKFKSTTGIDIDKNGLNLSKKYENENLKFLLADSMKLPFKGNSFDVVNCTHIYEHVPDSKKMISEIYRVLKPNGICFFAAGNRFVLIEGHYHLPLLSAIPKPLAHRYLQITKKGKNYYESHLSYWKLLKLVSNFTIIDYTKKTIKDPKTYHATDMIKPNSIQQKVFLFFLNPFYCFCPTYLWLLKKEKIH